VTGVEGRSQRLCGVKGGPFHLTKNFALQKGGKR
jgi:hypothetical protein